MVQSQDRTSKVLDFFDAIREYWCEKCPHDSEKCPRLTRAQCYMDFLEIAEREVEFNMDDEDEEDNSRVSGREDHPGHTE